MAALALALLMAGCGGSDDTDSAAPTATVRRSPTSTAAPATTTTTAAPGQEDFTAILRDLLARRDEAYEKNDISILEGIYSTQCACLANGRKAVEQQKAQGIHAAGARLKLLRTELVNRLSPTYAVVRGIVEQPPFNFVNTDGAVIR
ncbi:MAG TPA: hypothetical protein VFK42_08895, partial [Acidimicrobiales bacterium]|nr:hypothetical protein [Acidimicrobiales bacterium]